MIDTKTIVRCANVGLLVVGAVAITGSGGLGGCSSKSSPASPENDAATGGSTDSSYGSSSGSAPDGATTIFSGGGPLDLAADAASCVGASCSGLVIGDAPVIEEALVPGSPPAFTGGTLADGTYYLTSVMIYGGSVVSEVTEEGGFDDASGAGATSDGAISDSANSDGASSDGASSDGASSDGASSDGASSDGATSIGTPNGSFLEEVFSLSAGATIVQLASASGGGCTEGTAHVSTSGNMLTMIPFCGNPLSFSESSFSVTWPYTATSTTITMSVPVDAGATAVLTLTLQ